MNKPTLSHLALGLLVSGSALAPAAEPLVDFPPGNAEWTIAITHKDGPSSSAQEQPAPVSADDGKKGPPLKRVHMHVQRSGQLRWDRITWDNGDITETWWSSDPNLVMYQDPRTREIISMPPNELFDDMRLDQSAFSIITPNALKGERRYGGKQCLTYEGSPYVYEDGSQSVTYRAWVEKETLLPVALETSSEIYEFTFSKAPPSPLTLPADFAAKLQRFQSLLAPTPISPKKRRNRS